MMIAQWSFFLLAGQAPEVQAEPVRLAFHLAAEFATAQILIACGIGLLRRSGCAVKGAYLPYAERKWDANQRRSTLAFIDNSMFHGTAARDRKGR